MSVELKTRMKHLAPVSFIPFESQGQYLILCLIETSKANGLEPSKYLRYLFEKFPYANTSEDVLYYTLTELCC